MKKIFKLLYVVTVVAIVGCGSATPDKKEIARQCEKMLNEKLLHKGKVTKDITILKDGDGLVILSVKYGFENTTYDEKSVYCGSNGTTTSMRNKLSELKAVLTL